MTLKIEPHGGLHFPRTTCDWPCVAHWKRTDSRFLFGSRADVLLAEFRRKQYGRVCEGCESYCFSLQTIGNKRVCDDCFAEIREWYYLKDCWD